MSRDNGLSRPGTRTSQQMALPDWCILAALAATWVTFALVVDPRGNFPMLDDWSYGRAVKGLIQHGELRYDGWNVATLLLQVLYGAAFCWPFGFSFETLRISTLVAGLAGGIGTYMLLREAAATRSLAALGSLVMMLNPSYFQHSFTFMTDVPFAALIVFSSLYFLRALRTGSTRSVLLGTILAACATLVRQPGMMIPVAFGLASLATSRFNARLFVRATLPASAAIATYIAYAAAIRHLRMEPALLGTFQGQLLAHFQDHEIVPGVLFLLNRAWILLADISLMVLPLLAMLFGYAASRLRGPRQVLAVLAVVLAVVLVLSRELGAPDLP